MRRIRIHPVGLALALAFSTGCGLLHRASRAGGGPAEYREPIAVDVRNENFLDMTISVYSHGSTRRMGIAPGNSTSHFSIDPNLVVGNDVTILATPIGGSGRASSGALSVSEGQSIEFRVAQVLRQSAAIVR